MASRLAGRFPLTPVTGLLLVGDALALVAFVVVGALEHNIDPVSYTTRIAANAAPFVFGWLLVALVGGLYTPAATDSVRETLRRGIPAWFVAVVIAQTLRSTDFLPGNAPLSFVLVSLLFGGLFLLGWRVLATVALGYYETGSE